MKSAADLLIESPCVLLAREDPDRPFSFAPVEVLKGELGDGRIDLFLDSVTRRILAGDATRTVVLARDSDRSHWKSLGLASVAYEAVVRRILLQAPEWEGTEGGRRRTEFFLSLFGHADPVIGELAYVEMGRAPYAAIRRLGRVVPREQLKPMLTRPQYVEWRSLAILLLAHRGAGPDRRDIVESFHTAERFGLTNNLAAWAAAAIELQGAEAIAFVENRYFHDSHRSHAELVEVLTALSLHGTEGHTHLRNEIVTSYGVLLAVHPALAPRVARDLLAWNRFDLREELGNIVATGIGLDYAGRETIRRYLRLAATLNESAPHDG